MKATRANGSTSILTDEDIGEILNRVGKDISKAVDRHELKKDIEAAWDNYCGY